RSVQGLRGRRRRLDPDAEAQALRTGRARGPALAGTGRAGLRLEHRRRRGSRILMAVAAAADLAARPADADRAAVAGRTRRLVLQGALRVAVIAALRDLAGIHRARRVHAAAALAGRTRHLDLALPLALRAGHAPRAALLHAAGAIVPGRAQARGTVDRPGPRAARTAHVAEDLLPVAVAALHRDRGLVDRARGAHAAAALAHEALHFGALLPVALAADDLAVRAVLAVHRGLIAGRERAQMFHRVRRASQGHELLMRAFVPLPRRERLLDLDQRGRVARAEVRRRLRIGDQGRVDLLRLERAAEFPLEALVGRALGFVLQEDAEERDGDGHGISG